MQGLIIENIANLYKVKVDSQIIYEATARGKFKKEEISPVVGDWVKISIIDKKNRKAVIEEIKSRDVYIKRPKLSNITQIVFVVSSKNPKPDLLMLDKQLAFAEFIGVNAIIVLNKTDLDDKQEFKKIKEVYKEIGYDVIETDAKARKGIAELKQKLKKNISAFSGNSGVGKSTLINGIFDKDITQEGEISKKNKRGKYIADTPGFSTFDISEIESKDLANYFKEFRKKISHCEFVGCTHIKEENCGVKEGIQKREIDINRYKRFCKIYEELKLKEERKKW